MGVRRGQNRKNRCKRCANPTEIGCRARPNRREMGEFLPRDSVEKVSHAGEDHSHAQAVGSGNHFRIFHGATGLNDAGRSRFCSFLDAIREGEERIGGHRSTLKGFLRLQYRDLYGVDGLICPAPMPMVAPSLRKNDGIGFNVLADFPGKLQVASSASVGSRCVTTFSSIPSSEPESGSCTSMPPRMRFNCNSLSWLGPP